jgi:hypothetical protein
MVRVVNVTDELSDQIAQLAFRSNRGQTKRTKGSTLSNC